MIQKLIDFLSESPVNFLAVQAVAKRLEAAGYKRIDAGDAITDVKAGDKIYVTKNDSSIYAFHIGKKPMDEAGFRMICAHSDSPTFRIKPNAEMLRGGMLSLNTEVYGGPIMSTWFDRPLSLAGRVILRGEDALHPVTKLLHIQRPLLSIPNLAIHFNRQVNDGVKLLKQKDMLPLMAAHISEEMQRDGVLLSLIADELNISPSTSGEGWGGAILDFDLYLYDTTPACTFGLNQEFISAGRLDDLSMVHAALEALLATSDEAPEVTSVMAIFDNEETGSQTKQGAGSPFLSLMLQRLIQIENLKLKIENSDSQTSQTLQTSNPESWSRAIEHSFMISADNAHAWHPNYSEKYDPKNHPVLGGGPVIKFNAAQKYASDAYSAAVFSEICRNAGVPSQKFVNHSDCAGGSTLGNILASSIPLRGVDMGNGVLAMHSCRETGSCDDHIYCIKAFTEFYKE